LNPSLVSTALPAPTTTNAPQPILGGAYLPGPTGSGTEIAGPALRSHLGQFTVAAHFDPASGQVVWGDRLLSETDLAALIPTLPGWSEAVSEAGTTPLVIMVACGAAAGTTSYLASVSALLGTQMLGATNRVTQRPTGDLTVESDDLSVDSETSDPAPAEWLLLSPDQSRPESLGADLTAAIGALAARNGDAPALAVTPPQDGMPDQGYGWGREGPRQAETA
jgi:hypothetical protein